MPRLLQLVHGFPPRENAGTEQYAARVAEGLRARGWHVHTLAATQRPGAPMYARSEEPHLTRYVHNAPYAGRRHGGRDAAVDALVADVVAEQRPDVVHLQHPASSSTSLGGRLPPHLLVAWTLHDGWGWCPAGGQRLRMDVPGPPGAPCDGPGPACAACASAGLRDGPAVDGALRAAAWAARVVSPERLHRAWKRVPAGLRARVNEAPAAPLTDDHVRDWREAHLALARRCQVLLSPSRALADEAEAQGFPPVTILPHGVDPAPSVAPPPGLRPFLFLGTLSYAKGAHVVVEAHRRSGVANELHVHGPPGPDATYVAGLPQRGPLGPAGVTAALRGAQALVVGSLWPENAPLVVLEALAAGCPVIAPRIGGLPELYTPPRDGWAYPPGDTEALARILREAASDRPSPAPPRTFAAHLDGLEAAYAQHGVRRASGRHRTVT